MRKNGRKTAIIPVAALLSLAFASHAGAAPPASTAAPTVTGTPKVGEVLTAQNGTWANNPDGVPVPVAALQRGRRRLRQHRHGDAEDVHGRDT